MLDFTFEIMGRISEEDKKMSGSWICLVLVVCRCFEGLVPLPLSLPSLSPENDLRHQLVTNLLEHPSFLFSYRLRERIYKSTYCTEHMLYYSVVLKSMGADSLLSNNRISSSEWPAIVPCFTEEK